MPPHSLTDSSGRASGPTPSARGGYASPRLTREGRDVTLLSPLPIPPPFSHPRTRSSAPTKLPSGSPPPHRHPGNPSEKGGETRRRPPGRAGQRVRAGSEGSVGMSTPARKRLMRDFKRLQQDPPAGISGAPHDNNITLWNAVIFGPDDTPWDGGTFKLTLQFTEDYPNKPPTVRFVSRMFHPNNGSICLDILQNQWSPIYDVAAILTSIQSLLCDPNPNSPANSEAARMYSENKREYNRKVREVVEQSWTAD
ncbi:hypothetical protein VPH35_100328 [Triticum aestivum]